MSGRVCAFGLGFWVHLWVSLHHFPSIKKIDIVMPKQIEVPRPQPTPQPPTDDRPSSSIPPSASRRGRGDRFPYATPRNTYSQAPIRWAIQPPSSSHGQTPNVDNIRRRLDALPSPSAVSMPRSDPPAASSAISLPPPAQRAEDDVVASSDSEEPLLTQPPDSSVFQPPPPSTIHRQFDEANASYTPPLASKYPPPPTEAINAITEMFRDVWGIDPRPYQVSAVFYIIFLKLSMTYLIRKTGEGKSMVWLGMCTILRGINVCMVPLLGLGSAQAPNSRRHEDNIEAYHLDEFKSRHCFNKLKNYLLKYKLGQRRSIILYISPQMLVPGTKWFDVIHQLAVKGCVSSFCIDEVHAAVENSQSFRPAFGHAVTAIKTLIQKSNQLRPKHHVPLLVMSATFRLPEQRLFNKMVMSFPDLVLWGGMDRRNVGIFVHIAGNPLNSLLKDWHSDSTKDPDGQALIMTNSARACDESIIPKLEKKSESMPHDIREGKHFYSFTGECGLMMKNYLMACFCHRELDESLPFAWAMACTSAANCGVSSTRCKQCYRLGPCPNWYDLLQEAGRVDRLHSALPGQQSYRAYLNVTTFVSLWIRVQSEPVRKVRERQLDQLFEVLDFLVLPSQCYHESIEEHFENPLTYQSRGPCVVCCSFCTKSHVDISGRVSRQHVVSALLSLVVGNNKKLSVTALVPLFTDKKNKHALRKSIWGDGTNVDSGKVHGLVLMLIAAGIIRLSVPSIQIGKKHGIEPKDVTVQLAVKQVTTLHGAANNLVLYDDIAWSRFHLR